MNYKDEWIVDEETGEKYIFTVEMQRKLDKAGLAVEPDSLDQLDNVSKPKPSSRKPQQKQQDTSESDSPASIQIDPQTGKYIGRVKWYNTRKGYGFIMRGGGEEIFFHKTGAAADPSKLNDGQWVLYDVEDTKKGPEATDVETYDGPYPE